MKAAGEGLDPNVQEPAAEGADLQPTGESPETTDGMQPEPPAGEGQDGGQEPEGEPAREAPDSDEGIFATLEKGIPEELKPQALEMKKRVQGYLTKKTQAHAKELQEWKSRAMTPETRQALEGYSQFDVLLQQNPKEGFRQIAQRLQQFGRIASADEFLASFGNPENPEQEEIIDPENIQDWQTARKYLIKELKARDEKIARLESGFRGSREEQQQERQRAEFRAHGEKVVMATAQKYPDFAQRGKDGKVLIGENGEPVFTEQGRRAIQLVLDGRVTGENALDDAWALVTLPQLREQLKQVEGKNKVITGGIRGSQPAPGTKPLKTNEPIKGAGNVFDRARESVLQGGLGV